MTQAPATVDELGLQGCLYLWALLTAQDRRLPVAPTRRMAFVVLAGLHGRGVIDVADADSDWEFKPDARVSPIEGFRWRLTWMVYEPHLLTTALEDYFDTLEWDDFMTAARLCLWTELGSAEAEHFFEQQLVKHKFPAEWAQDMAFAYREKAPTLTIAQWRYCAWAAVRRGASMALQQSPQAEGLREAIYQEIRCRAVSVASGAWKGCSFPPFNLEPHNALGRGFASLVTHLGPLYWTAWPSIESLLGRHAGCACAHNDP